MGRDNDTTRRMTHISPNPPVRGGPQARMRRRSHNWWYAVAPALSPVRSRGHPRGFSRWRSAHSNYRRREGDSREKKKWDGTERCLEKVLEQGGSHQRRPTHQAKGMSSNPVATKKQTEYFRL